MSFGERVEEWVEARKLPLILGLSGMILLGVGMAWWRLGGSGLQASVKVLSASTVATPSGTLIVDVAGAVTRPGVYSLEGGARVVDALQSAGGVTTFADMEWIDKYLNRSEKVKDGQKIYIPKKEEIKSSTTQVSTSLQSSKVNINTAGQGELEALPGIGPVTAQKIMAGRPYGRPEELLEKKIVGQSVWGKISELVAVW